jgi:hypothetical protein
MHGGALGDVQREGRSSDAVPLHAAKRGGGRAVQQSSRSVARITPFLTAPDGQSVINVLRAAPEQIFESPAERVDRSKKPRSRRPFAST